MDGTQPILIPLEADGITLIAQVAVQHGEHVEYDVVALEYFLLYERILVLIERLLSLHLGRESRYAA